MVNSKEKTDQYDGKTESLPRGRQQRDHYDNHGNQQSDHDYGGYDNGPAHYDSYDHDFEHDFEDSYRSEIPQEGMNRQIFLMPIYLLIFLILFNNFRIRTY